MKGAVLAPVGYLLAMRQKAMAQSDWNQVRALEADLERVGWRPEAVETAMVDALPEKAVPASKRGRPKLPRCEHGQIVGRCLDCEEAA